jgi:hypothetical protein
MSTICRPILVFAVAACMCTASGKGQDSPPLGDLARQQRQQKEQSKTAQGKDAKASKVITNEEIPEHGGNASAPAGSSQASQSSTSESSGGTKQQAEHVKSQILAQKTQIATLQGQVDEPTAWKTAWAGTNARGKSSSARNGCNLNWKKRRDASKICRIPPVNKASEALCTIRSRESSRRASFRLPSNRGGVRN